MTATRKEINDMLDEEFQRYLEIAKALMLNLKRSEDREIIASYIRKCCNMNEPNIDVKENRNEFFRYFLKMLETASNDQPPQYDDMLRPPQKQGEQSDKTGKDERIMNFWSKDKRTYVSAKVIPGFGALIYMAVTNKAEYGWQKSGFSDYTF